MKRIFALIILFLCYVSVFAQADRQHIRQGNHQYHQQKYDKAEINFRKATDANSKNPQAMYNLGCALMQQQKDSAAIVQFENASEVETNKFRKSKSYHNIGVICQNHQMFAEAIDAYKESLRNNPKDDETRYNLALCQKQLKNQDNNQDQQNQQSQDNNQDKEDKEQKKEQNKNDDKEDQDNQTQNQQPQDQMSRENAEQLLQAAMRDEQEIQDKMQKQQTQPQNRRLQKNW